MWPECIYTDINLADTEVKHSKVFKVRVLQMHF